jgi:hypothetical protein
MDQTIVKVKTKTRNKSEKTAPIQESISNYQSLRKQGDDKAAGFVVPTLPDLLAAKRSVRVRQNKEKKVWVIVDEKDQVLEEHPTLVLEACAFEEIYHENCTHQVLICGSVEKGKGCVQGWVKGKLVSTDVPKTFPAETHTSLAVGFQNRPGEGQGFYGVNYQEFRKNYGSLQTEKDIRYYCKEYVCHRSSLKTADYLVLDAEGRGTAFVPK